MRLVISGDRASPFDGEYLVDYDPSIPGFDHNGEEMLCHLATYSDKSKAKRFGSMVEVMIEWKREHGLRPDCKPNRPLTSFTMSPEKI